jgi:hypothetical protein
LGRRAPIAGVVEVPSSQSQQPVHYCRPAAPVEQNFEQQLGSGQHDLSMLRVLGRQTPKLSDEGPKAEKLESDYGKDC